jgi:hypothetical protein
MSYKAIVCHILPGINGHESTFGRGRIPSGNSRLLFGTSRFGDQVDDPLDQDHKDANAAGYVGGKPFSVLIPTAPSGSPRLTRRYAHRRLKKRLLYKAS